MKAALAILITLGPACAPAPRAATTTVCVDADSQPPLRVRQWIPSSAQAGYPLVCADLAITCSGGACTWEQK